jgi:hypothetical protein
MKTMIGVLLSLASAACIETMESEMTPGAEPTAAAAELAADREPSAGKADDAVGRDKAGCGVRSDGRLYCGNRAPVPVRRFKYPSAEPVNWLRTTYSWFDCFGRGDIHHGGNDTWYLTQGDDGIYWGWVAAGDVYTSSEFDAHPDRFGLEECEWP